MKFINNLDKRYNILDGMGAVLDAKQKYYIKNKIIDYLKKEFAMRSL